MFGFDTPCVLCTLENVEVFKLPTRMFSEKENVRLDTNNRLRATPRMRKIPKWPVFKAPETTLRSRVNCVKFKTLQNSYTLGTRYLALCARA